MSNMKRLWTTSLLCAAFLLPLHAQPLLQEYVSDMKGGESPVEYVFRLFESADIIVLGERDHRDMTQYELITRLLADPRFAERVGHVYTEIGVTNMTRRANQLIKGSFESWGSYLKARLDYLRDEDYLFCWEKTNRSVFIDSLYSINSRLPENRKITLGLTDVAFDWHKPIRPYKYRRWWNKVNYNGIRDKVMADNFIRLYKQQKPIDGHRKALVITNLPHAVNNPRTGQYGSEGYRIKKKFGDKVRIVCLNWVDATSDDSSALIDDGRWDAAFELTGHRCVGFNLAGTAFGRTPYCLFGAVADDGMRWQDVADGIVWFKPFYEFLGSTGIDGFVADSCRVEQQRRLDLLKHAGVDKDNDYERNKAYYNTVRTYPCDDAANIAGMKEQMERQIRLMRDNP